MNWGKKILIQFWVKTTYLLWTREKPTTWIARSPRRFYDDFFPTPGPIKFCRHFSEQIDPRVLMMKMNSKLGVGDGKHGKTMKMRWK